MRDNAKDRQTGAHWERQFGILAGRYGLMFTPHQLSQPTKAASAYARRPDGWEHWLLPDITVWSAPGEHHEIKHKSPTRHGSYGLERYRLDALVRFAGETGQHVLYTIHDWQLAGADRSDADMPNHLAHWFTAEVTDLAKSFHIGNGAQSYINGRMQDTEICYWPTDQFDPLWTWWQQRHAEVLFDVGGMVS